MKEELNSEPKIGDTLRFHYYIENTGQDSFPCLWTFHGLVRYEEDMEIIHPNAEGGIITTFEGKVLLTVLWSLQAVFMTV